MDWTKIPTDLLVKRYSDNEIISIVKFQLLWALREERPDEKTMRKYMTKSQVTTANNYADVIDKYVSTDINYAIRKRGNEKIKYNKNKELRKNLPAECQQTSDRTSESLAEQIRLDKNILKKETNKEKKEVMDLVAQLGDKLSLKNKNKNSILISESFCFVLDDPNITPYVNAYGEKLVRDVERWLKKNKMGEYVDLQFISRQFNNFADKQGIKAF